MAARREAASVLRSQLPLQSVRQVSHFGGRRLPVAEKHPDERNRSLDGNWRNHMEHRPVSPISADDTTDAGHLDRTGDILLEILEAVIAVVVIHKPPRSFNVQEPPPFTSAEDSTSSQPQLGFSVPCQRMAGGA